MRFVLDTQIFLHYKLFTDCDWKSILGEDRLILLIPPTVLSELDKKKYDQRDYIRNRARDVISRFREIRRGEKVQCGISVEFFPKLGDDVDWTALGLNNSNKDHRIIAEILRIKTQFKDENICIVTADMNMELQAENFNIKVICPPDGWLLKIKDPRDKRISELEKTIPKVRLCFYDERDKSRKDALEISIRSNEIDLLNQDNIEIEHKVSQIKEYITQEIEGKRYDYLTAPDHIKIYENNMWSYPNKYKDYLYTLRMFHEWKSSAIKIKLCLENVGNIPADDVDIWIVFPRDIEVLKELPECPKEPHKPKPPKDIFDPTYGYGSYNISQPDLSDFNRNLKGISGPDIQVSQDNVSVHYWRRKLKQGLNWPLPLYIKFKSNNNVHAFHIEYSIKIGNMPMEQKGALMVALNDKIRSGEWDSNPRTPS